MGASLEEFDKIRKHHPRSGFSTSEPSLEEVVFRYYSTHFDEGRSREYTQHYFADIERRGSTSDDAQLLGSSHVVSSGVPLVFAWR